MSDRRVVSLARRALIERLGYGFEDPGLVDIALSHRSVGANNNERMEFLGDSILNFVIAEALFEKFPESREGALSQMRAQLVKGVTLAEIARDFELGENLILGGGEKKSGGHRRESILADAVEALIGAIYIDGGMKQCRAVVLRWYSSRLKQISPKTSIRDAKSLLQELLQSRKKPLPNYRLEQAAEMAEGHQQAFEVYCEIAHLGTEFKGVGSSRRIAEQQAASVALQQLQNL